MNITFELPKETLVISRPDLRLVLQELMKEVQEENKKDSVMTIKETAEYLKVSVPTVRAMIAKKEIPFFQKGQVIRLYRMDVMEWLRNDSNR